MRLRIFALFLSICVIPALPVGRCGNLPAQDSRIIDSLKLTLKNAKHDTTRAKALLELGDKHRFKHHDSAFIYYQKSLKVLDYKNDTKYPIEDLNAIKKLRASSFNNIGVLYFERGDMAKALENYVISIKLKEEVGDKKGIGSLLSNIGSVYRRQGNVTKALDYYSKSLRLHEEIGNKEGLSYVLNNLAIVYHDQGDIPKALEYYRKSLLLSEESGDKKAIARSLVNIASVYKNQGAVENALEYFHKALKLQEELQSYSGIAATYNGIATVYSNQNDFSNALFYNFKSLEFREKTGDKQGVALSLNNIGSVYLKQENTPKALEFALKALGLAKETRLPESIKPAANLLSKVYKALGDHKLALENYELFIKMRDSLDNIETQKATIKQQTKYEYEKKEAAAKAEFDKQQALNQAEIERKQILLEKNKQSMILLEQENELKRLSLLQSESELKQKKTEADNQQKAIALLNKEKEIQVAEAKQQEEKAAAEKKRQNIIIASVSVVLLLVAVFSVVVFNRFRVTQKQKAVIEVKEIETRNQKHIIEEKHKEITDSINYAERIQRSFLATQEHLDNHLNGSSRYTSPIVEVTRTDTTLGVTSSSPDLRRDVSRSDANYFVMFQPKDVVSGDFYWSATLNNGNFALATADSTGHGVPGAIMSLLNITSLEKAIETESSPDKILNATRKIIIDRLKKDGSAEGGKDGMDCSLCVFDFKNNKLFVANANNPVWIVRNTDTEALEVSTSTTEASRTSASSVIEIKADKMPVGKHDKQVVPFTLKEYELQKGDIVYTLTDGFPDQFGGEKGKKFMSKNLRELLVANSHLPMQEQRSLLEKTFKDWVGDLEQVDDVTVIGIRI